MNHPTSQADELLLWAKEAMNAGDRHEAIAMLRKATREAPLRRDIRLYLASVLESESVDPDVGLIAPEINGATAADRVSEVARNAFHSVASHTAQATAATRKLSNMLNQGIKTLATGDSVFHRQERASTAPLEETIETAITTGRVMRSASAPMAASTGNMRSEIEAIMEVMDSDPELMANQSFESQSYKSNSVLSGADIRERQSPTLKRVSRDVAERSKHIEDAIGAAAESLVGSCKSMGWKRFAYTMAFVFLSAYTIMACAISYKRFFSTNATAAGPQMRARVNASSAIAPPQLNLATESPEMVMLTNALANLNLGKNEEAVRQLTEITTVYPGTISSKTAAVELARLLEKRASDQLVANKISESVSTYRQVVTLAPNSADYQIRLANALFYAGTKVKDGRENGNLNESIKILQSVLEKDSSNLQAHTLSASSFDALGKKDLARKNWERIKVLAPAGSELRKSAEKYLAERRS